MYNVYTVEVYSSFVAIDRVLGNQGGTFMSQDQVLSYLSLVERRCFILMHSGIDWKPEYAQELQDIDSQIAELRPVVDAAHARRCQVSVV